MRSTIRAAAATPLPLVRNDIALSVASGYNAGRFAIWFQVFKAIEACSPHSSDSVIYMLH
jgi:hypothetical protein